jgi:3-oxoacyl-[acyl-carrier protein] reductase
MDRTILLVGAGSGIGSYLCRELLKDDQLHVIGCGRSAEKLAQFAHAPNFEARQLDVTDEDGVKQLFESIRSESKTISAVVNCAGSVVLKPAHLISLAEFNATILVNLTSCFLLLKYGIPLMDPAGGSFLFFSTAAGQAGLPNHDAIAAAKGGIEGLARAAAATYAAKNIRVNVIAPGLVKTPLTQKIHGNPTIAQASTAMHSLGRLGEPEEVASLACWMLSAQGSWMTGQCVALDGGLGLKTKAP